jgi:tetratricopeptide (TPR) repeat protein
MAGMSKPTLPGLPGARVPSAPAPNPWDQMFAAGKAALDARRPDEALELLERCVALKPDHADAVIMLVKAYSAIGATTEARRFIGVYRKVKPDSAMADMEEAKILLDFGQTEAARDLLRAVTKAHPLYSPAWSALSKAGRVSPDDDFIDSVKALMPRMQEGTLGMKHFCYALAKAYDDIGEYDLAFEALLRAKAQQPPAYNRAETETKFAAIRKAFSERVLKRLRGVGAETTRPVFVVGMPRSGTSLIEQILASHSDVFGAGELEYLGRAGAEAANCHPRGVAFPECIGDLSPEALSILAFRYLRRLERHDASDARVIDKMPHNFILVGLAAILFSGASIVHARRDPFDTCLSCFMHEFVEAHGYNRSLADLGHYYRQYKALTAHWAALLPDFVFEASYEALLEDQRGRSEALLKHVGLEWDERVLSFQNTERRVATPSNAQVRQGLYKTSKARWRNYERHLTPLMDALVEHR